MVAAFDSFEMTASEYLTWEPLQDLRYEFINGQVVAMTGGTIAHNDIALNLNDRLRAALRPKGCRVNVADVKVQVEATGNYFYPDVIVSCDDRDRTATTEIRFPELLISNLFEGEGFWKNQSSKKCKDTEVPIDLDRFRQAIARHPNTSIDILQTLVEEAFDPEENTEQLKAIVSNPNLTSDLLDIAIERASVEVRQAIVGHPQPTPQQWE